jgi:DNA topoisomerase-1
VSAIRSVAAKLGNTPTVCRACYIHPKVIQTHLDGELAHALGRRPAEAAVLALLHAKPAAKALLRAA